MPARSPQAQPVLLVRHKAGIIQENYDDVSEEEMKIFMKFFFNSGVLGMVVAFSIAMFVHGILPIFTTENVIATAVITFFQSGLVCGSLAVLNGWK